MGKFLIMGANKIKRSFKNSKPTTKVGLIATGVTCLAIVGASSNNPNSSPDIDVAKPVVVSDEEMSDALDKCILLKASNFYSANSKTSETELFKTAEKACEAEKTEYENQLDKYVEEVNDNWSENNSSLIAERPLTYYLESVTGQDERVVAFANSLQIVNRQRAEEEAKKKAEEEAKKQAEAAAAAAKYNNNNTGNSTNTQQNQGAGITGYCKDGTPASGNPSARGKANSCYGHGGWVR